MEYRHPKTFEGECFGKTSYATKAKAITRIQRQVRDKRRRKHTGLHTVLVPYRCPHCHQWHVGGTSREDRVRVYD